MLPAGSRATGDQSQSRLIALSKGDRGRNEAFCISSRAKARQPLRRYGRRRAIIDENNTQSHPSGVQLADVPGRKRTPPHLGNDHPETGDLLLQGSPLGII